MDVGTVGRIALLPLSAVTVFYYARYWHHHVNHVSKAAVRLVIIAGCLMIISVVAAVPKPTTLFLRSVTVVAFHQCALLTYFAIDQLTKNEVQRFYTTRLYRGATLLVGVNLLFEWFRRDNLGSFIDQEGYRPDALYYAAYIIFYALCFFFGILIISALLRFMQQNTLLPYRLRTIVAILAYALGCVCAVVVGINLGLSIVIGDQYRVPLNELYHALKAPIGILLMFSAAPGSVFALAARPLHAWTRRQQAQRNQAIRELHSIMIQIVPRVHLPNESLRDLRAVIEIGDARDVIWSHVPQTTPITPKQEAALLTTLLRDQKTIATIGPHVPPETRYPLETHILKVAISMKQRSLIRNQYAIPQLPGLPVLGNIGEFRSQRLDLLRRVQRECGDVGIFRVGVWPVVLLNAPNDIATVLVEQADAFEKTPLSRRYLRSVVGNGVIMREGPTHRQRRRLMAPAFQHRRIAGYAATMVNHADHMQDSWVDGQELDLADAMMGLTLWIAGTCLFHVDLRDSTDEIGATITDLSHMAIEVANRLVPVPMSWPTPQNRRLRAIIERMDTTIYQLIADHRRAGEDHGDVLSMLLRVRDEEDGSALSDQDVRDELVTLLVAGHETTATALAWSWYLLMQHPGVYQRVRDEVDRVAQGRQPTAEDLPNLPYTLQVFKEALRLYPPSWVILRQAREAVSLEHYHLPQGMRVAISPYTLHRNPAYFPDPERFDPDRWTPENEAKIPRYAYLPFGAGPHVCIGNHFAMMEAQLVLATLVQHVTFELVPGQTIGPEPLITLRPRGGIRVVVRRR